MSTKQESVGADLREMSVELVTTIGGTITSLATIGLNYLLMQWLDLDLLSLSAWFVVPAGALCGGMAAASGYYVAARATQQLPSRKLLLNMLLVGASTWALGQWLPYNLAKLEDGTALSEVVSFWEYFKVSVESTQLTLRVNSASVVGTTGELGSLGYVREALQLLGFMLGGFVIYIHLTNVEACQACRRYAKTERLLSTADGSRFHQLMDAADVGLPDIAPRIQEVSRGQGIQGLTLVLCRCPKCSQEWLRPEVVMGTQAKPVSHKLARYDLTPEHASALRGAATAQREAAKAEAAAKKAEKKAAGAR